MAAAAAAAAPLFLASADLPPLPAPASALPGILRGLAAPDTSWELQIEALTALRQLVVHHPHVLLQAPSHTPQPRLAAEAGGGEAEPAAGPGRSDARRMPPRQRSAPPTGGLRGAGAALAPAPAPAHAAAAAAAAALLPLVLSCIASLRSGVSRHGMLAAADLWAAAGRALDGELEGALPALLRRSADSSSLFLGAAADEALGAICAAAGEARLLGALIACTAQSKAAPRVACAVWLDRAAARWQAASGLAATTSAATARLHTAERLMAVACGLMCAGAPAARHAGHRIVVRLLETGLTDDAAIDRALPAMASASRVREALARGPPPADAGGGAGGGTEG